jgi:hypothetical protein
VVQGVGELVLPARALQVVVDHVVDAGLQVREFAEVVDPDQCLIGDRIVGFLNKLGHLLPLPHGNAEPARVVDLTDERDHVGVAEGHLVGEGEERVRKDHHALPLQVITRAANGVGRAEGLSLHRKVRRDAALTAERRELVADFIAEVRPEDEHAVAGGRRKDAREGVDDALDDAPAPHLEEGLGGDVRVRTDAGAPPRHGNDELHGYGRCVGHRMRSVIVDGRGTDAHEAHPA